MNTNARRNGMRRTVLSLCLAAALGSGSSFAARHNGPVAKPAGPSWGQLHRSQVTGAAARGNWRTRLQRASAKRATGGGGGSTIVVTSCADDGPGSLREAAANVVDNGTIDMSGLSCPGSTISLITGAIEVGAASVYIVGPGADKLTIDGGGSDRVLVSTPGNLGTKYLGIANGKANGPGGCILTNGGARLVASTISGCHVEGDSSGTSSTPFYLGGGIAAQGDVILAASIVSGNTVSVTGADNGIGGGVYAYGYAVALYSTIESNTVTTAGGSARGGGAYSPYGVYLGQSHVIENTVTSTDSTAYGGGLNLNSHPAPPPPLTGEAGGGGGGTPNDLIAIQSTISGNTAHSENKWAYGGGIRTGTRGVVQGAQLTNSTISGNTSSSACDSCFISGGGVSTYGPITASYSTFSDNHSVLSNSAATNRAAGGGLYAKYDIELANSTVSGNAVQGPDSAPGAGGGIFSFASINTSNSTIAFNQANGVGGGIYAQSDGQWSSTIVANNQAPTGADAYGGFTVTGDHNLVMAADAPVTLPADSLTADPVLLPLHGNGGPTATHALASCSPAIDAGSNPQSFTQDQRGEPFSRSWGANQDIGAFELQPDPDHIFGNGFETDPCPS